MTHKVANPISRLATVLLLVGVGKLVLGAMILILAFTGYDTPKPVNGPLLLIALNLLMLGGGCLAASRAFQNATIEAALERTGKIFGYYLLLLAIAIVGVGYELFLFLIKIFSR